jgi:hypothetical protein
MKTYRFGVGDWDNGYFDLHCIDDKSLFTQARSLDEAVLMARDVVLGMRGERDVHIALLVPANFKLKVRSVQRRPKRAVGRGARAA